MKAELFLCKKQIEIVELVIINAITSVDEDFYAV